MKTEKLMRMVEELVDCLKEELSEPSSVGGGISEIDIDKLRDTWGLNYGYCKYCRRGPDTDESDDWEDANEETKFDDPEAQTDSWNDPHES